MSEPSSSKLPAQLNELIAFLHERQEKRGNCTMKDRAELWLRFGGEQMDISPPNFHHALATWLANAGLVHKDKAADVAAVLCCLGVTNSNNQFQKVDKGNWSPSASARTAGATPRASARAESPRPRPRRTR